MPEKPVPTAPKPPAPKSTTARSATPAAPKSATTRAGTGRAKPTTSTAKPATLPTPRPPVHKPKAGKQPRTQSRSQSRLQARSQARSQSRSQPPLGLRVVLGVPRAVFSLIWALLIAFLRLRWQGKVVVLSLVLIGVVVVGIVSGQQRFRPRVIAALFTPPVQYWSGHIQRWAAQYGVDPNLIATVMQIESCGLPSAESTSRAQGLFQVMPFHFPDEEKASMTDPEINAMRGMGVLTDCLSRTGGDAGLAMACYNGGPGVLSRASWPDETNRYYYWGTGIYADALTWAAESGRLKEWLAAGGASLCQRASAALGVPAASLSTASAPLTLPLFQPPSDIKFPPVSEPLPTFDARRR